MEHKSRGTFIFARFLPSGSPLTSAGHLARVSMFAVCLQLLTKDPESRLSSLGDVQSAPYLSDMNWDAVFEKALTPGFVPNVSGGLVQWHAIALQGPLPCSRGRAGQGGLCRPWPQEPPKGSHYAKTECIFGPYFQDST